MNRRFFVLGMSSLLVATKAKSGEIGRQLAEKRGYTQEQKNWIGEQNIPGKNERCCNEADGDEVQERIEGLRYFIKGSKFPDWTVVPEAAVIRGPNKIGQPIVWWYEDLAGKGAGHYGIKCYCPGAGL